MEIIDAHIHCGDNAHTKKFDVEEVLAALDEAGATGAVIFAFPEDMYRIVDTPEARARANRYVLDVARRHPNLIPFYFVWNDFAIPPDLDQYKGIKWHRHADEPRYDYADPNCERILSEIRRVNLPVVLEEEFDHTVDFVRRNPALNIIIPHMGKLNGGYRRMDVFFDRPNVFFDTAVAPVTAVRHILDAVGPERVIFGSDVSGTAQPFFNYPKVELAKLRSLGLDEGEMELILSGNIKRLVSGTA